MTLLRLSTCRAWDRVWGVWSVEGARDVVLCESSLSQSGESGHRIASSEGKEETAFSTIMTISHWV